LLVASTGGHLEELVRLRPWFVPAIDDVEWATFDEPQSRSLLDGARTHWVNHVPPRGYRQAVSNTGRARNLIRSGRFDRIISTGAGVAVPFMLAARMARIECHYIESAARSCGPSLTGKLMSALPGVRLYTQYPGWAGGRWSYQGSLFDGYVPGPSRSTSRPVDKVVVTLGTLRTYSFRAAVEALLPLLEKVAPTAEVLWQVGVTPVEDLKISGQDQVPASELHDAMAEADLVIAHAGIGSSLAALDLGHCPVLLPRRAKRAEHVDDHQVQIAEELDRRRLAVSRDPADLTADDLIAALGQSVLATPSNLEFILG
jgi:UDP-N-acetylglucosamine transferase subunit ALG13